MANQLLAPQGGEKFGKDRSWHIILVPSDTPGEVESLQWIFESYVNREVGFRAIAAELNAKDILSPQGGKWGQSTIRSILRNCVYKGVLAFGKRAMGKFHRLENQVVTEVQPRARKVEWQPVETWITGNCPALVSEELWDQVQARFQARSNSDDQAHFVQG